MSFSYPTFQAGFRTTQGNQLNQIVVAINAGLIESKGTVAAAGTTYADATALVKTVSQVTGADGTVGVIIPAGWDYAEVYNAHATAGLKVYAPAGGDINDGTQNAAIIIEGKTLAVLRNLDGTTWAAQYTVNT